MTLFLCILSVLSVPTSGRCAITGVANNLELLECVDYEGFGLIRFQTPSHHVQDLRTEMCEALNLKKTERTLGILAV